MHLKGYLILFNIHIIQSDVLKLTYCLDIFQNLFKIHKFKFSIHQQPTWLLSGRRETSSVRTLSPGPDTRTARQPDNPTARQRAIVTDTMLNEFSTVLHLITVHTHCFRDDIIATYNTNTNLIVYILICLKIV